MTKPKMHSPDLTEANIDKIAALFPHCITESHDEKGHLRKAIDFDLLRQELSDTVVEGPIERYTLNWPGKREAMVAANEPVYKTLRPCEAESVNFATTKNLYLEGDNLEVLKLLQETYLGKVKMIYIDPPYNTGNDFIYEDNFTDDVQDDLFKSAQKDESGGRLVSNLESNGRFHSDWLTMMYPRLKLARDLLREDGVIFISIDDNEVHNLRKVCDEVFGANNFIAQIIWEKRFTRSNNAKLFTTLTEPILCYRKSSRLESLKEPRNEKADSTYSNPDEDPRGIWTSVSCVNPATREQRPNLSYDMKNPFSGEIVRHPTNAWKFEISKYNNYVKDNRLYWGKSGENKYPRLKKFLYEMGDGMVPVDLWKHSDTGTTDKASKELEELFNAKVFTFPKPPSLIRRMLNIGTSPDSIILDFFSGSATTAHAVMQLNAEDGGNRRFIMVQLPEACNEKSEAFKTGYKNICEIGKERIRRAGQKIKEENATTATDLDIGFRVFKVDSSNMKDVYYTPDETDQSQLTLFADAIKDDRLPEDLLFQVFLDSGLDLALPVKEAKIEGKTVFIVDENVLVACFENDIPESLIKSLAKRQPLKAVFLDRSFAKDSGKINVSQIFKQLSPETSLQIL